MHASNAFLNGAAAPSYRSLDLLRALMAGTETATDPAKRRDERQAEVEQDVPSKNKPGGFKNDPDDGSNPNEVRERHNETVKPS